MPVLLGVAVLCKHKTPILILNGQGLGMACMLSGCVMVKLSWLCHTHTHARARARTRTHARTHARTRTHTHTHVHGAWMVAYSLSACIEVFLFIFVLLQCFENYTTCMYDAKAVCDVWETLSVCVSIPACCSENAGHGTFLFFLGAVWMVVSIITDTLYTCLLCWDGDCLVCSLCLLVSLDMTCV